MTLHFGVHCSECSAAEVTEIPEGWIALEPAQAIILLSQGQGIDEPEVNMQVASEITDFFEVHEAHGAMPVILQMSEIFHGRKET